MPTAPPRPSPGAVRHRRAPTARCVIEPGRFGQPFPPFPKEWIMRQQRRFVPCVDDLPPRISPTTFLPPTTSGGTTTTTTTTTTTSDGTAVTPPSTCTG